MVSKVYEVRNRITALAACAVVLGMVGAAYAAVPLYQLFCQVTGFGGTTQIAAAAPGQIYPREITVEFDANISGVMPWHFQPAQRRVKVRVGEESLAFYTATNPTERLVTGQATYNVSPAKVGKYFSKIECFCFTEQSLEPGQTVDMGLVFFLDPAILDDPNMNDVDRVVLSYTFFETERPRAKLITARDKLVPLVIGDKEKRARAL